MFLLKIKQLIMDLAFIVHHFRISCAFGQSCDLAIPMTSNEPTDIFGRFGRLLFTEIVLLILT